MKKISIPILSIIAGATAALSLILRIICLIFFYDDIGYYKTGAVLPIIANILFALSLIFFFVTAIFSIDKKQSVEPTSKLSQYAALLPLGALLFRIITLFTKVFNDTNVNKYFMLFSAIAAAIFFLLIFFDDKRLKNITFYIGIGALLFVFLCWMFAYFDFFIPINSTDKTFFYLACAGAILFIFNEMCAYCSFVRSRFYYFSLFTAIITLSVASISAIIGYAFGIFKAYITLESDIFFIALLIYAIARLIDAQKSTLTVDEPATEDTAEKTEESEETEKAEEKNNDDSE